ncbi:MAG TPA: glycosyltransferase [Candidatus Didemnitutus sp.]|nr:glycosyltransferase [Candidatus Didemnitutus sp.]
MVSIVKPRLLYFNGPWGYLGARILSSYIDPFRRLLEQDFEVISVEGDRDFRVEVENHRPDLVMFHTGSEAPGEPEVTITNTDAFPEIPRLGYMFRDPFSPSRMPTMNRLKEWRADQVFTDFRPTDSLAPYFRDTMYLPWWIDDTVFRDYGEEKEFSVTLTGSGWLSKCIYLWRSEVCMQLLPRVPIFHAPSLGNRQNGHDFTGESYSRLLNRSRFSAGCGTVNRYLTMKLLEIPASRCCLIAEEIEVLKAAGFRDGENCVFATKDNVAEKVRRLLAEPERLRAITDAGYRLVHERHTQRNRRVFAEWYELWKRRKSGDTIVQVNPLQPLQLIPAGQSIPASTFPSENPLVDSLQAGYRLLAEQRWTEALAKFEEVVGIIPCVAEARLGAAVCLLRLARPADAIAHLSYNVNLMVRHFGYRWPDPIDLAFLAVSHFRAKDARTAVQLLASFENLRHPSLNAMRWIIAKSSPALAARPVFQVTEGDESSNVETIHVLPPRRFAEWTAALMAGIRG